MAHVAVPGPFDFALTTERFRAFGIDRANVWHEGGLHRVVAGRELRIEAAPGGVDANPLDAGTEPVVHALVALAIRNRLIERFGEQVGEAWAFPARERIAAAGEEELFALGFSRRKAEYLV